MTRTQTAIPCAILRGGTSRGVYFRRADLPVDETRRDRILLQIMGGPDALQIDGIGGGHPLNNKVAIVGDASSIATRIGALERVGVTTMGFRMPVALQEHISFSDNLGRLARGVVRASSG